MASIVPSSGSEKTLSSSCPSVFVSNDLMQLIDPDKEKDNKTSSSLNAHLTTMEELLMDVKNYIVKNKLYDPTNPVKVIVHETELGSLLGKSEFSIFDVRDILIEKFVYPVEAKNSSEVTHICSISEKMCEPRKRKSDYFFDTKFSAKKIKNGYESSDESILSIQGYETEYVKDTASSDDNFSNLIFAETFDVDVEYEIESDSDFACESDSDIEDIVKNAVINFIAHSSDSDLEYLADGSSGDESHSEEEISEKDKWCCLSCFNLNHPRMGLCGACLVTREGWLSDKKTDTRERNRKLHPERSKRKLSKRLNKNKKNNKDSSNFNLLQITKVDLPKSLAKESLSTDVFPSPSNSLEAKEEHLSKKSQLEKQLCLFCCEKPADSSILHGKSACKICCFKCGNQLLNSNQRRCPACRRVIERVVYLFNA